jgi:hypothetical protein
VHGIGHRGVCLLRRLPTTHKRTKQVKISF